MANTESIFLKGELLTSSSMKTAGWLAMTSAFLTLPLVYLSFRLEGLNNSYTDVIQALIQTHCSSLQLSFI